MHELNAIIHRSSAQSGRDKGRLHLGAHQWSLLTKRIMTFDFARIYGI